MTDTAVEKFVDAMNDACTDHEEVFTKDTPMSRAVSKFGMAPEAFAILLSSHTGAKEEDILDSELLPENTVEEVFHMFQE